MRPNRFHALPAFAVALAAIVYLPFSPSLTALANAGEVVPSGTLRSETREPGHFVSVAVGGPFDVEVRQGKREAVTITGDDNLLPLVETTIDHEDGEPALQVRLRHDFNMRTKGHLKLVVEVVDVHSIALGGVGDVLAKGMKTDHLSVILGGIGHINLPGIDTKQLTLTVGGSGSINTDGRANDLKVVIAGSGNCDSESLAASDVAITIAGSGNAHVRADKALKVTIAGTGNVTYRGDVEPTTSVVGSGKVSKV
jgi:Putative auto-transporter adhesin, head GIN domain